MSGWRALHCGELFGSRLRLKSCLPGLIRHAVDRLTALILAHCRPHGVGFFLEPIRQAVAAEARQIHQVDVLNVGAGPQMLDKTPKYRSFKFRSGFVVNRHGLSCSNCPSKKLSHIFPDRDANITVVCKALDWPNASKPLLNSA